MNVSNPIQRDLFSKFNSRLDEKWMDQIRYLCISIVYSVNYHNWKILNKSDRTNQRKLPMDLNRFKGFCFLFKFSLETKWNGSKRILKFHHHLCFRIYESGKTKWLELTSRKSSESWRDRLNSRIAHKRRKFFLMKFSSWSKCNGLIRYLGISITCSVNYHNRKDYIKVVEGIIVSFEWIQPSSKTSVSQSNSL